MRRAARVDATQEAIVRCLRTCGISVEVIGKPVDLLICVKGVTELVEVKTAEAWFTKEQTDFLLRWPGKVHIVRSVEEALRKIVR